LFRQREKVPSEFRFHGPVIVGSFPLFNRKHPIRVGVGKFPILVP
jgi:hypothetical protein